MADQSLYPTGIDPVPADKSAGEDAPSSDWNIYMDAVVNLEEQCGLSGSPTTTTLDYMVRHAGGGAQNIFPCFTNSLVSGTWVWASSVNYIFHFAFYNSSNADGNQVNYKVYLSKGTYTLKVLWNRGTSQGIVDVYIDAVEVDSWDNYGTTLNNQTHTKTDIEIRSAGVKTLSFQVDGRHASSSGYYFTFQMISLYRTA